MSKHARTRAPGLQLNGREVATDAQLLILSFLSMKELLCLRPVSHGWRTRAEEALSRLASFTLEREGVRALDEALRWCRRLQTLTVERDDARVAQLIAQNHATLTAIESPFFHIEAVWDAVYKCRTLRRLRNWDTWTIGEAEVLKLLSSFPQLEDLTAFSFDWDAFLSSPTRLPLKRLSSSSSLRSSQLAQLVSSYPDLVEIDICPCDVDPLSLFEALSQLPRLERVSLNVDFMHLTSITPPPPENKWPVLKALRSLKQCWVRVHKERAFSDFLYFFAPALRELELKSYYSTLPIALLVERFPGLTSFSVRCDFPSEDSEDVKATVALLSREPKPWAQLSRLHVEPSRAHSFVPFLSPLCAGGLLPALTEMELSEGALARGDLLVLRSLPVLRSLSLSSVPWSSEGDVEGPATFPPLPVTHGLEKLSVDWCDVRILSTLAVAFRFPRLRAVCLRDIWAGAGLEGEQSKRANLMPLLLPSRETLQELRIVHNDSRCKCLRLSFPPGIAEAEKSFPRLRVVDLRDCEVDEDVRRALAPRD